MTAVVRLDGVRVVVAGKVLLDIPRLQVDEGERVAIVGPNGAGKSTLLKLIGTLIDAQHGCVEVLGHSSRPTAAAAAAAGHTRDASPGRPPPLDRRALRRDIGVLMQGLHLVPRLTARENVLVGALARLRGRDALRSWCRWYPRTLVAEADAALAALGLADRAGTRADHLSGGERQKVALARLQLQAPRLLLADEPTSALDPSATREACVALRAVASAPGRTLLTVVHDVELLPLLATRVLGLAEGRVRWDLPLPRVTPPLLQALYQRDSAPGLRLARA